MCLPILVHKLAVELKGKLQDGIPDPPLTCIFVSTCRCAKSICLTPAYLFSLIACILQAVYDCQLIFLFIFVIESFLIILLNIYRSSDTIVSILTTVCCADGRPGRH